MRFWLPLAALVLLAPATRAADHETCLDCHDDPEFETRRGRQTISLHIDLPPFLASVHGDLDCTDCHSDVDADDLPHEEQLEPVGCADCHDDVQTDFDLGVHGQALTRELPHAPACASCHGKHDIASASDESSPTFKMNIPFLCGGCHREGAPVANLYDIGEHNIVENYSQSIHGEGLFEKGLTVTATCNDCHLTHRILPHTNPAASISPRNIAGTCMKCHSRIEDVHEKIIRGELWETKPGAIPACTDCHLPHKVRKEIIAFTLSNRECLECHADPEVAWQVVEDDSTSMLVNEEEIETSVHVNLPCVKCHTDIDPRRHRPCETSGTVDCSNCHAKIADEYVMSGHGQAFALGTPEAPRCTTCHGDHGVLANSDDRSATFRASVPELCGDCHREGGDVPEAADLSEISALADYSTSVHGRGLTEKGLLPVAICIDCHGAHQVLKHTDDRSMVHVNNIAATCASCHRGIYKQFIKSIHFAPDGAETEAELPNCTNCHSSHTIDQVEGDAFLDQVNRQCGSCHRETSESYLETMHGKAYRLGYLEAAKCSDCHGAHEILGVNDPLSSVGHRNIVETCRTCHEDANTRFTGYLTHATHHDPVKYPTLYYTYWSMTFLLVGVFSFFGVHTVLWLPRSFREMARRRADSTAGVSRYYIRRFNGTQRITHLFVITSFLSLAFTGMMLRFSFMPWAENVASILGGVRNAGVIHRIAAVTTFGYFIFHLITLARLRRRRKMTWRQLTLGPKSMMFSMKDVRDFGRTMKWFVGRGPQPDYGRWTYWEKFDYLAVFWGVAIIGLSGLMLWFPEFFTIFVPGWFINVATIIHSDEALLAVGFIFTIHFFNTHLRPEAFPMDTVIFTGLKDLEHYKKERPLEYAEMKRTGELRRRLVKTTVSKRWEIAVKVFGFSMLGFGVTLIGLIIYSVLLQIR